MIEFIILCIAIFLFSKLANNYLKTLGNSDNGRCKLHKWERDTQDMLRCTVCHRKPSEMDDF